MRAMMTRCTGRVEAAVAIAKGAIVAWSQAKKSSRICFPPIFAAPRQGRKTHRVGGLVARRSTASVSSRRRSSGFALLQNPRWQRRRRETCREQQERSHK